MENKSTYSCAKVFPMAERVEKGCYDYKKYHCDVCGVEANWLTWELRRKDGVQRMIHRKYCKEHLPDCYETFEN